MKTLIIGALFFCQTALIHSAWAKTGYVDMSKAFEQTKQGRRIKTRLDNKAEATGKALKSAEMKIQEEEKALKKEAPLLSEQARMQKIGQLQQKIVNFQKEVKQKEAEMANLQNTLMSPLVEKLTKVIGDLAKKEGFAVVKNVTEDVLWVSPELDLTKKAVQSFNKKHK